MPGYPADTAGGIMSTDFLAVPWTATVEDALQRIRGHRTYVVDGSASSR
jgi:Mg/Co/Ni transporter MgtE